MPTTTALVRNSSTGPQNVRQPMDTLA